eukprot:5432027-Alexandrium_andersonii.AAC.1
MCIRDRRLRTLCCLAAEAESNKSVTPGPQRCPGAQPRPTRATPRLRRALSPPTPRSRPSCMATTWRSARSGVAA